MRLIARDHIVNAILAICIGALGGLGAILFRFLIKLFQALFYQNTADFITFAASVPLHLKILLPLLGGLLVGPIIFFIAPEAKGSGISEIMEALSFRGGKIRSRLTVVKMVTAAVSIGSGGSVGREGPIVTIGSAFGSVVGQWLKASQDRLRTLMACGAAAGIAATFNAPMTGVLFAVEILLGDFRLERFSPIILASITANAVASYYYGSFPSIMVPPYQLVSVAELGFYALLGILAGLVGFLFISTFSLARKAFDSLPVHKSLQPAIGGALLGIILIFFPQVFGVGYETLQSALKGALTWQLLTALVFMKILATCICLGSGASGGILAPSLFIGAMLGGSLGVMAHGYFPELTAGSGAYALVGMGALVAGVTHGPITAILTIFELTGNYQVVLPVMTASIISTLITSSLKETSIYTIRLKEKGLDIYRGLEQSILVKIKVGDVMTREFKTILKEASFDEVVKTLGRSKHSYLIVTNAEEKLEGIISFHDVRPMLERPETTGSLKAIDIATKDLVSVTPEEDLESALYKLGLLGVSQLPVVAPHDPTQIVGVIRQKDIIATYRKKMRKQ